VTSREFRKRLDERARRANLSLAANLAEALEGYFHLLSKWNSTINLTGLDLEDPDSTALDRLLIEPLVAAYRAPAPVSSLIDIGSGGGSPAIPMALALMPVRLLMVESKSRKSIFLREAARTLGMTDAQVITARYEALLSDQRLKEQHDLLTIRAVRVAPETLERLQGFVRPGGSVMLFSSESREGAGTVPSTFQLRGDYRLLESLQSRVVVLERR
jgi:16S rRNA (guanine527-N7)-methyltransferase